MPDETSHIRLACHNIQTACFLNGHRQYHDWTATVAFYAALHVAEAVFAMERPPVHGQCHEHRDNHLKGTNRYEHIYRHYRPLWAAATVARYLENPPVGVARRRRVKRLRAFSNYMTPTDVCAELLQHRLVSIIRSSTKFISKGQGKLLNAEAGVLRKLRLP